MVLYTQKNCPQCRMIHMLLDKTSLQYEECQDIEVMQASGVKHTPAAKIEITSTDDQGNVVTATKILQGKELTDYVKGCVNNG